MDMLNLEKQLRFYGAYHHHPVNVGIHIFFVPVLLWTGFVYCCATGVLIPLPEYLQIPGYPLNLANIGTILYVMLYVLLEPVAGTAFAFLVLLGDLSANWLYNEYGTKAVQAATAVHVASWIAQFIGHGKFEGRAPALLDNIFQAIFLAPLFVWLEVLFACGYRPELKSRLDEGVKEDIAHFKQSQSRPTEKTNGHANGHAKSS